MSDDRPVPSRHEIGELIAESERLRAEAQQLMQHMEQIRARIDVLRGYGAGRPSPAPISAPPPD